MCSCSLFFFTAAHFPLGGHLHLSFSHRRYKIFMFFFKRNWSQLFFISRAYDKLTLKFSQKKDSPLLMFFPFIRRGVFLRAKKSAFPPPTRALFKLPPRPLTLPQSLYVRVDVR